MKTRTKPARKLSEDELDRKRALAAHRRHLKSVERNEILRYTRFHADGRREVLYLPAQEIYKQFGLDIQPLDGKELRNTRLRWKMTQEQFARWLMVSIATVRNWEQKTGLPRGPALRLIHELTKNGKKPDLSGL